MGGSEVQEPTFGKGMGMGMGVGLAGFVGESVPNRDGGGDSDEPGFNIVSEINMAHGPAKGHVLTFLADSGHVSGTESATEYCIS